MQHNCLLVCTTATSKMNQSANRILFINVWLKSCHLSDVVYEKVASLLRRFKLFG